MNISLRNLDIRSLFASKIHRTLPAASGPFRVGFCDIEYQSPTQIDSALPNMGNIYLRLFYPSSSQVNPSPLKQPLWITNPKYLRGYLNFMGLPESLGIPLISILFGHVHLPCIENGDLALTEPYPALPSTSLPMLLFSHGLGGMRTSYSYICYELASYGFVVASFEHLDGTASISFTQGGSHKIPYDHSYAATNEGRQIQLRHRVGEIKKSFEFLSALQNGMDKLKVFELERSIFVPLDKHSKQSKLRRTLEQFQGKLDLSTVFLSGHSFGAMTAIETSYQMKIHRNWSNAGVTVKAVLAFDPWMAPAGEHLFNEPLSRPTLVINSHFFHDERSINQLHRLFRIETKTSQDLGERDSKIITLMNTGHHAHTDLPLILPPHVRNLPGIRMIFGRLDPKLALDLIAKACREFTSLYLPNEWRKLVSGDPTIFHTEPHRRPKDIVIGTSSTRAA